MAGSFIESVETVLKLRCFEPLGAQVLIIYDFSYSYSALAVLVLVLVLEDTASSTSTISLSTSTSTRESRDSATSRRVNKGYVNEGYRERHGLDFLFRFREAIFIFASD
jgi:hypothetical protein